MSAALHFSTAQISPNNTGHLTTKLLTARESIAWEPSGRKPSDNHCLHNNYALSIECDNHAGNIYEKAAYF